MIFVSAQALRLRAERITIMSNRIESLWALVLTVCLIPACLNAAAFDVKAYGAKGDGKTPDRDGINKAVEAAFAAGGGTVYFPPEPT